MHTIHTYTQTFTTLTYIILETHMHTYIHTNTHHAHLYILNTSFLYKDELPMIYAATSLLYVILEPDVKTKRIWLGPALSIYLILTTICYILMQGKLV